ncbi:MAG: hypothetical protein RL701_6028 [Pseudomonadota bacterium]|jgi:sterol desaturase/sphingolipid hydroxylase (fatty acid hydroxylase superfamily)
MFIGLCFVEGVITKRSIRDRPPTELVTDSVYWFLSPYFRVLSNLVVALLLLFVASLTGHTDATKLVQGYGPVARQPFPLIMLEALVLSDLMSYWAHRAMHRFPLLWRFHSIHHSAKELRWSTIGRVHPLNEMLNYCVGLLPCLAIGMPIKAVLYIVPVMMWWAVAVHSNFKITYGPLSRLFVSPIYHRWHHTHSHEGGNSNFANVLSLWDHTFGTYYLPKDASPTVFGLDQDVVPESYLGQLLYPFAGDKPAEAIPVAQVERADRTERADARVPGVLRTPSPSEQRLS